MSSGLIAVTANLVMNYSPHLPPDTKTSPPAVEIRSILKMAATDMLRVFLRKWRRKRRLDDPGGSLKPHALYEVNVYISLDETSHLLTFVEAVDVALTKIYVKADEKTELLTLLREPNDVGLPDLESVLVKAKWFGVLCEVYQQRSDDGKLLDAWSRFVLSRTSFNCLLSKWKI